MTRMYSVLLLLACVGCDDSKVTEPTPVAVVPAQVAAAPQCQPFDLEWSIDVDASGPHVVLTEDEHGIGGVSLDPVEPNIQVASERGQSMVWFAAHFDTSYRIKAKVGDCWSTWHDFRVGPKNPDASGQTAARAVVEWTQCRNHYIVDETFDPPVVGPYHLTVRTEDRYHRAGYQVGQVETLAVSTNLAIGFTQDIPDNATWIETTWENLSGRIRVKRDQGSVHGVCVTVRQ